MVVGPGNKLEARNVTIGIEAPDRVEIRSGVRDGELVAIGNRAQLKPGATVSPQLMAPATAEGAR